MGPFCGHKREPCITPLYYEEREIVARNVTIKLRVTPAEKAHLEQAAGGPLSEWIRRVCALAAKDEFELRAANKRRGITGELRRPESAQVPQHVEFEQPAANNPADLMTMEQYLVEAAEARHWEKLHLDRREGKAPRPREDRSQSVTEALRATTGYGTGSGFDPDLA